MNKLIVIAGTNASGKSSLGIELAERFSGEVVSADSRQIYTGLDLGSGKVTEEEMRGIPHHLLDVAQPNDMFTLSDYQEKAYEAIDDIISRGKVPFLVGGTGLYVNAVADGYQLCGYMPDEKTRATVEGMSIEELIAVISEKNPEALERLDLKNKRRLERAAEKALTGIREERPKQPRYETLVFGITWPRDVLYERIRIRLDTRLEQGMIDEVVGLRRQGASDEFLYRLGLEYRYILMYLRGEFGSYEEFYDKLFMEIRHLAKEQMTWFRKRNDLIWMDMSQGEEKVLAQMSEKIEKFTTEVCHG